MTQSKPVSGAGGRRQPLAPPVHLLPPQGDFNQRGSGAGGCPPGRYPSCLSQGRARQASLSITNSQGLLKLMSIESVMPSNHLILCCPLLLLPSIFPSIRVFSNDSALRIRWPKYWSFTLLSCPPKTERLHRNLPPLEFTTHRET